MTASHCKPVVQRLLEAKVIECEFKAPSIRNHRDPRPLRLLKPNH